MDLVGCKVSFPLESPLQKEFTAFSTHEQTTPQSYIRIVFQVFDCSGCRIEKVGGVHQHSSFVLPYISYKGMCRLTGYGFCRSTGYGFCLSKSGTGSTNQRFSLEQGILFAIPTLEHGRGDHFAAKIAL